MPERMQALTEWLEDRLGGEVSLTVASADASFRRYFRVGGDRRSYIAMDAPPAHEDCRPFLNVAALLEAAGVHVPHVIASDTARGFLLLEDLGDVTYLEALRGNDVDPDHLYRDAIRALVVMQSGVPTSAAVPAYDRALLRSEMELFRDWLLGRHLALTLSTDEQAMLDGVFAFLEASALEQPLVFVHRDYHSRNLMVVGERNPGVLDFQDAVIGPLTYDLVSLLRDCYIAWPDDQVRGWLAFYRREALAAGIEGLEDEQLLWRRFGLMGIQRHLKAAGIFARLNHRDGKNGYLADIPRTLNYVVRAAANHDELRPLVDFLGRRVVPALARAGTQVALS
ncbi:MAG: phosphotransferase [Gammaproteobacteria bacterium]|jgi:aminoglycoside/choline kinase family phosphotransferase